MNSVLVSLSGGLDSTTLLAHLIHFDFVPECVSFNYGSKHNKEEIEAAKKIAKYYNVNHTVIDLREAMSGFKSDLLLSGGVIPKGHYNDASMARTVVPGRNMIFTSILAGYAESNNIAYVALGIHQGDHHIYPDCRPDFFNALNHTVQLSTEGKVRLLAPFLHKSKTDIVGEGLHLKVPYELTRTCYEGKEKACGTCGSCVERLEAFASNGTTDPIEYEN